MKAARHSRQQAGTVRLATILILVTAGLTILPLIWLSSGIMGRDQWPIQWLEVDGPFQRVSAEQVRAALAPHVDTGYFAVDLTQVREIARRIPWVADAQARKQWPDTVHILVLEHQPSARWVHGQLINAQNQPFKVPEADQIQGLPILSGPEEQLEQVLNMWRKVQQALLPIGADVSELHLEQRGSWRLTLSNGVILRLGREAVVERLHRFVNTWPALQSQRAQGELPLEVDLRYANGFSVHWPNGTA